ncbi:hypothetical protein FA15DRAFT_617744 [Coprinopsis marcescibilis]|uniref:Uncharacterized protein n=1 Tax=Coprinopsis marcescibilis TaxID=230819 RepID=A0A5C3KYD7_COPMA|nr:hypothetical protein FA15DRAFT_617744 [Coprinopsis marcescibilis]
MSTFQTIQVDDGTQLAYTDSGAAATAGYTTVFIIHGTIFYSSSLQTIVNLGTDAGLRLVAINRRDYPGSTPLSIDPSQITGASDDEKAGYLRDRGLEILRFVDLFIQANNLPQVSEDRKSGGVAILGWALGAGVTFAALAHASLDKEVSERLSRYVRAHILLDPPAQVLGQPTPPEYWLPLRDQSIQEPDRMPVSIQWVAGYFDHGDITKRDKSKLSWSTPSTKFLPTTFSAQHAFSDHAHMGPAPLAGSDGLLMAKPLAAQLEANYRKACFDSEVRSIFPHLKVIEVARDMGPAVGVIAFWKIQDDDAAHGGGHVAFDVMKGANHFVQWDHPDKVIDSIRRAVGA